MKDLNSLGLKVEKGELFILDQQKLPKEETWLKCNHPEDMIAFFRALKVRGAPLIGVAAALSLARFAQTGVSVKELIEASKALRNARPTAVNLMICLDRLNPLLEGAKFNLEKFVHAAEEIFYEDVTLCDNMANFGAALVKDGDNLLTHCNAGGLATVGIGTAIGVIIRAHEQGKKIHVWVDETRPLLQGGRITAWELGKFGVPYTLICDNMAASIMAQGKVQRIFVGSDRVALNGDFANKIGTYNVAVIANYHKVPFHPVAPYTTICPESKTGKDIPIEQRAPHEVCGAAGSFGDVRWAPTNAKVTNPAFDVTPVELVESFVCDQGVFSREELKSGVLSRVIKKF